MDSITGRVTRSTQRLSVEKSDKEDDPRSTASTPTKKKPAKRLSIKPGLEDVMETDGDNKLGQIKEENPMPDSLIAELKKKESLSSGTPTKDTPSRSLRKRTASTCSPEGLNKSPQTKSPPTSEIVNTKTPKKTMLKKIENSLLQNLVDSPKPRKKRNSIGGSDADGAQELTPLRRSRRLSTELNVVVEDLLREEQSDHVQIPITRRGKRLSVVPLQPTLPEENEDQKESESTSASPMALLNVSLSKRSPNAPSPSKANSTPASPLLLQNTSLTRRDRKSKSPTATVTSPMSTLSVSLRSEKSPKTPKPQTPNRIDSTSLSPVSQDVSLTRNDRKSRTPKTSLNKSELISESSQDVFSTVRDGKSPKPSPLNESELISESTHDVSSTVSDSKSPKTSKVLTPNKSFKQTPNSSKSALNLDNSFFKNVSSPLPVDIEANTSTGKLNKSTSRKSINKVESPTKSILNNITSEVTEPTESNNTSSSGNELPTEVCNLSQTSIRRSPRKNKSIQNMSIDEGISENDTETLSGDSKLNVSLKNTSISAEKHNQSTHSLVSLNQSNVEMEGNKSVSSKKSNGSLKLKFSDNEEDNDVEEVVKFTSMNASAIESKANDSVTSSTMRIVYASPLKTASPNTSALKSNKKNIKSSDNMGANNDVADITDINYEESIATSTPFVKSIMDKSRTPSSLKNTSVTNKSQEIESSYETPKRDQTNSFTKKSETGESVDISSGEEDEDAMQIVFHDSQASDAGSNYQSGDSMDESEREEIKANEIVEKGESLNSESGESDNDSYEKDSFICTDEDESIASISSDEEIHEITLPDEDVSDKSSKLSKSNESAVWKDEVNVLSNSQPGLSGCTLSAAKSANASLNEKKRSSIGLNNVSKSNESFNTSKRESTTLISTSNKSSFNLSMKTGTPNKSNSDLSMKTGTPNKVSSNLSMKAETPNKSSPNLSLKAETPNKSSSNLSMKAETPNKSGPNLSLKAETPNKSSSNLSMKAEKPNKSKSNLSMKSETPNKSSSNLSMKAEALNKSSSNLSNNTLLEENDVAQSPKPLSIADLNNTSKSIANVESDVLSLSTINVSGISPNELLANLTAGSMSTPNTGKLPKASVPNASLSSSINKRLSLDKSKKANETSKVNDSIKEDNVLSTSCANSSGFFESNSSNSKLISDSNLMSTLKNIETLINSKKRISLNSSNASKSNESLENKLEISKSPAKPSTSNTPKKTKKSSLNASLSTSFGQKDPNKSITKLLNGSGSAKISAQEIAAASPKPACSPMEVDLSDECETLNENSFSTKKSPADVSSLHKSMEKRKSQPMGELNSNILPSKQPETKLKAAASTEFEVEPVNIENIVVGTKRKLEADSQWTCTAGDFQVVKKQRQQPTRSISASDYGSTTSFKIVPLKKTPKALLQVDTFLESNVVNFKQDMLYGKRCPRKESSKLLKIQQKLKASKNRGSF